MLAVVAVDGSAESTAAVQFVQSNCLPACGQLLVLLCQPQQHTAYSDSQTLPAASVRRWRPPPPAVLVHSTIAAGCQRFHCLPLRRPCPQGEASGQGLHERFPQAQVGAARPLAAGLCAAPGALIDYALAAHILCICAAPLCAAHFALPAQAVEVIRVASGSSDAIAQAILDRAQQLHASLLCIAPHSRSALDRVLVGSVTDFVVRWAGRHVAWRRPGGRPRAHVVRPAPPQLPVYFISTDIMLCRRARLPVLVVRGVEAPGRGGAPEAQPGA